MHRKHRFRRDHLLRSDDLLFLLISITDPEQDPVGALGTLQLRRLLRAVGLLSEDLARERSQETLADKVREAIATGRFASYVEEQRLIPKDSFQCGESSSQSSLVRISVPINAALFFSAGRSLRQILGIEIVLFFLLLVQDRL